MTYSDSVVDLDLGPFPQGSGINWPDQRRRDGEFLSLKSQEKITVYDKIQYRQ